MASIPTKVSTRISDGLKRFQPIIESAKIRDVNESDTVVLMTGILSEVLGFDKYTEITTELAIRGTFCDLALKIDGKFCMLIEAKAIGLELKDAHVKQAVDYAANKGMDWVILSNAVIWRVYKIIFSKPIDHILVCEIDLLKLKPKSPEDIQELFLFSKESIVKKCLEDYYSQKQATDKFIIGNLMCNESILNAVKKELKFIYPEIKVSTDEILNVISKEVIKRELLEGENAEDARKKIAKVQKKKEKQTNNKDANEPENSMTPVEDSTNQSVPPQE